MAQSHKNVSKALSHNKLFVQCINKIICPSILRIQALIHTIDYRIIGAQSYLGILDKMVSSSLKKFYNLGDKFQDSLYTLDWDIVIIPRNVCGCFPDMKDPEKDDYHKFLELFTKEINNFFNERINELVWLLNKCGLKFSEKLIMSEYDHSGYMSTRFSIEIVCDEQKHNVCILDLFNGTDPKKLQKMLPYPKIYYQDFFGFKYSGFPNILHEMKVALIYNPDKNQINNIHNRLLILLNCAANGLLNNSYYDKIQLYLNKYDDKESKIKEYMQGIQKLLNDILSLDIIKSELKNHGFIINYESSLEDKSITLSYSEGKSILSDPKKLFESIFTAHMKSIAWSSDKHNLFNEKLKAELGDCCKKTKDKAKIPNKTIEATKIPEDLMQFVKQGGSIDSSPLEIPKKPDNNLF